MTLPDTIYSPDQVSAAILELNTYQAALHDAMVRSQGGQNISLPEPGGLLSDLFSALNIRPDNGSMIEAVTKDLSQILTKSPVVHITLAAAPTHAIKKQLTAWFRTEINPSLLITFAVRSDLGGGIVLRAGSKVYDFSFKRQLLANKQRIAEIAQSV